MDDLPPPNTTRWTIRRKAAVVVAVRSGNDHEWTTPCAGTNYRRRNSSPGNVRSRRTASPVCVPRVLSNTAGRGQRAAPDRDADFHRFLAQRPGYVTEEQQAASRGRDFSFKPPLSLLKILHAF